VVGGELIADTDMTRFHSFIIATVASAAQGRSSPLATVIPAVYLAAARLVREPHWDHHGLRSDLRHIGTAIEAGVVLVVPQLLTRLGASGNVISLPRYRRIPQLWHRSSHHLFFAQRYRNGHLAPARDSTISNSGGRGPLGGLGPLDFVCNAILSKQIASSSI
jgi:hypothetical protein